MTFASAAHRLFRMLWPRLNSNHRRFAPTTTRDLWPLAARCHSLGLAAVAVDGLVSNLHEVNPIGAAQQLLVCVALGILAGLWMRQAQTVPTALALVEMLTIAAIAAASTHATSIGVLLVPTLAIASIVARRLRLVLLILGLAVSQLLLEGGLDETGAAVVVVLSSLVTGSLVGGLISGLVDRVLRESNHRMGVLDAIDGIFWEESSVDSAMMVSSGAERVLGHPAELWAIPNFWRSLVHPADLDRINAEILEHSVQGSDRYFTFRMRNAHGEYRWIENHVSAAIDADGVHTIFRGLMVDRTEAMTAASNERRMAEVIATSPIGHCVLEADVVDDLSTMRVIVANASIQTMIPSGTEGISGRLLSELSDQFPRYGDIRALVEHVVIQQEAVAVETTSAAGRRYSIRCHPAANGSICISAEDVSERHAAAEESRRLACSDSLTGLPNRLALREHLTEILQDRDARRLVALVVLDLNQFKDVNDALGHAVGDQLLSAVGSRLRDTSGPAFVARLGGDEFAVVAEVDLETEGHALGHSLVSSLDQPFMLGDFAIQTGASIGISYWPTDGVDETQLLQHADAAMYLAKRKGGGWAQYDTGSATDGIRRLRLIGELKQAVELEQFELWYQPIVEPSCGAIVRAEALIRWRHPEFGLVMPDEFVRLAEVSGSIKPITRWVVERAMADADLLAETGHRIGVSLNLSARNLYEADLVEWFKALMARRGMPTNGITLELTETDVMEDSNAAMELLRSLRDLGFENSIDDFGTGYTSLSQLGNLPVSSIKVDRSFVSRIVDQPTDAAIVRALIDLGHNLGLKVVAEGVEDDATLKALVEFGCDFAQGYYFSQPMPFNYFLDLVDSVRSNKPAWLEK